MNKSLGTCNYTLPTKRGVWECEQDNCNGTEHYAVFYPYLKNTMPDAVALFIMAGALGLTLGFLLYHYFGMGS